MVLKFVFSAIVVCIVFASVFRTTYGAAVSRIHSGNGDKTVRKAESFAKKNAKSEILQSLNRPEEDVDYEDLRKSGLKKCPLVTTWCRNCEHCPPYRCKKRSCPDY